MPQQRVVCVGNPLCHDDGVAFVVRAALTPSLSSRTDVELVDIADFGLASLDAFLNVEHVVVVDAVTTGRSPGTCRVLETLEFAPKMTCSVGHAVSLASMLELVALLQGVERTPKVSVVGIEAENLMPFGTAISSAVRAAVPKAVELVLAALSQ